MYEYTEMRARSIARTHRQSVQRMSRTLTRIAAFLRCPRAVRGGYTMAGECVRECRLPGERKEEESRGEEA